MAADSEEEVITAEQMKRCLMCAEVKTTEVELEEMLDALDLDHDGKVRMEDFVRLLVTDHPNLAPSPTPGMAQPEGRIGEREDDNSTPTRQTSNSHSRRSGEKCRIL